MIKRYNGTSWEEWSIPWTFYSSSEFKCNLQIHSGTPPNPILNGRRNIWLDMASNELFESDDFKWVKITSGLSVKFNEVTEIDGVDVTTITKEIEANSLENLNMLEALSISTAVVDGSIDIFFTQPTTFKIGDILIKSGVVHVAEMVGADLSFVLSKNSSKILGLINTYINLEDYKESTIRWFFQTVAPTSAKDFDMWYNSDTGETKQFDGEWKPTLTRTSQLHGNIDIGSNNVAGDFIVIDDTGAKFQSEAEDVKYEIIQFNYSDLTDQDYIVELGNENIDKTTLKLTSHPDKYSIISDGNNKIENIESVGIISETVESESIETIKLVSEGLKLKVQDLDFSAEDNEDMICNIDGILSISNGTIWKAI